MTNTWYKRAIIYELPIPFLRDSNSDGMGDFAGASQALDHLANLGVTCLWLLPFYESPRRDSGYDISNYYHIDSSFGSHGDFVQFLNRANERGLRIIVDITFNHTSNEHPWFQHARNHEDSPYRDYYIWADEPIDRPNDENVVGAGRVWTFDEEAGQYYHHAFYPHQPDLDLTNPRLREEIEKVLGFWLQLGVSGFRLDAVPHMIREKGNQEFGRDPFEILHELRVFVQDQRRDAILLGEVDVEPDGYQAYMGEGQLQMMLNFYLCNYLFLALATGDASAIRDAIDKLPTPARTSGYANFLRNHDELDLERLSSKERQKVFEAFAPDEDMRIYDRGIRRRLAPMLGDERRVRLAHSLLLSLPGTPIMYYGDEIGMGEDLSLPERASVRTPMQWSGQENAGFSDGPPECLVHPVISGGEYGYEERNATIQLQEPDSLLNLVSRAIRARRSCPELGLGEYEPLDVGNASVFAHLSRYGGGVAIALHNLSGEEAHVEVNALEESGSAPLEVFSDRSYPPPEGTSVRLEPFGFRWFRARHLPQQQHERS